MRRRRFGLLALGAVAALPLVAERLRTRRETCAMDGAAIDPAFRVRVVDEGGMTRVFCGVRCAAAWLLRHGAPREIRVTDIASGRELDGRTASYARTLGPTPEGAPDGIRVFEDEATARAHARAHGGKVLEGAQRPFAPPTGGDRAHE